MYAAIQEAFEWAKTQSGSLRAAVRQSAAEKARKENLDVAGLAVTVDQQGERLTTLAAQLAERDAEIEALRHDNGSLMNTATNLAEELQAVRNIAKMYFGAKVSDSTDPDRIDAARLRWLLDNHTQIYWSHADEDYKVAIRYVCGSPSLNSDIRTLIDRDMLKSVKKDGDTT